MYGLSSLGFRMGVGLRLGIKGLGSLGSRVEVTAGILV